jgi:hypothetical protein
MSLLIIMCTHKLHACSAGLLILTVNVQATGCMAYCVSERVLTITRILNDVSGVSQCGCGPISEICSTVSILHLACACGEDRLNWLQYVCVVYIHTLIASTRSACNLVAASLPWNAVCVTIHQWLQVSTVSFIHSLSVEMQWGPQIRCHALP